MGAPKPAPGLVVGDEAARRELWASFCSLVRSYVAGTEAGDGAPQVLILMPDDEHLQLVSSTRSLSIEMRRMESSGYWAMYAQPVEADDSPLADGPFRIGLDSKVEWTGLPGRLEMDAVAEAIATLILE